jgi:NAD(P)H-hydrate epimerase
VRRSILPGMLRLTRAQVREIDRRAIEEYGIPGIVLMENAARAVVNVAMEMLASMESPQVLILCGGGNNGGDGFAVARHLHNRGIFTTLFPTVAPATLSGDAAINWRIADAMKIRRFEAFQYVMGHDPDLCIDAIFGTGLTQSPRAPASSFISYLNATKTKMLAIDLPSGLDCDTGEPLGACIRATRTVTFVAEKAGFANPASREYTGEVTVGDIGCPRELIEQVAKMPPP